MQAILGVRSRRERDGRPNLRSGRGRQQRLKGLVRHASMVGRRGVTLLPGDDQTLIIACARPSPVHYCSISDNGKLTFTAARVAGVHHLFRVNARSRSSPPHVQTNGEVALRMVLGGILRQETVYAHSVEFAGAS